MKYAKKGNDDGFNKQNGFHEVHVNFLAAL